MLNFADARTFKIREKRGCIGVSRGYDFCNDVKNLYAALSIFFCEICDTDLCNPAYEYMDSAITSPPCNVCLSLFIVIQIFRCACN